MPCSKVRRMAFFIAECSTCCYPRPQTLGISNLSMTFKGAPAPARGSFILPESSQVPHSSAIFDTIPLINACCLAILSIPGDQPIFPRPQFLILLTLSCSCRALSHVSTLPKAKMSPALHGLLWRKVRTQPGVSIHPKTLSASPW